MNLQEFVESKKEQYKKTGFVLYLATKFKDVENAKIKENLKNLKLDKYPITKMIYEDYERELIELGFLEAPILLEFTKDGKQNEFSLLDSFVILDKKIK